MLIDTDYTDATRHSTQMVRRALLALTACMFIWGASGCGLVVIPYGRRIPPRHLRNVVVEDAETGEPIDDADVHFCMGKWTNWFLPGDAGFFIWDPDAEPSPTRNVNDTANYWTARPLDEGRYRAPSRWRFCWYHVLFPIGFPLGAGIFHDYSCTMTVAARDHLCVAVNVCESPPEMGERRDIYWVPSHDRRRIVGHWYRARDGIHFVLIRKPARPDP